MAVRLRSPEHNPIWASLSRAYDRNPHLVAAFASAMENPPVSGRFIVFFAKHDIATWEVATTHKESDFGEEGESASVR